METVLREKSQLGKDITLTIIPTSGETKAGRDKIEEVITSFL